MLFGKRVMELRKAKGCTLRDLAAKIGVGFTYLSKAENGKLAFADFPGEALIVKLAKALDADADELLIMAKRIPTRSRRVCWSGQRLFASSPDSMTTPSMW
jgi:HTH-type transcriptional regulator, competence development regulator